MRVLDPLKLELQMVLSTMWALGAEPQACSRSARVLYLWYIEFHT